MSKKETLEKFFKFMEKWRYEDFNAFENHFNKLMSMKSKEQLTNENEALKDSIAVILAQKKNVHKHCDEKNQQIDQLKQQLVEKDKEIENCKRNELYEENMKILAVKNQKQLAIQELEKVKKTLSAYVRVDHIIWDFNVNEVIDNQIKELKGEKDVKD